MAWSAARVRRFRQSVGPGQQLTQSQELATRPHSSHPWPTAAVVGVASFAAVAGKVTKAEEDAGASLDAAQADVAAAQVQSAEVNTSAAGVEEGKNESEEDTDVLPERVAELVGAILRTRAAHAQEFQEKASSAGDELLRRCAERAFEASACLRDEKQQSLLRSRESLETASRQRQEEASAETVAKLSLEVDSQLEALKQEAERALAGCVLDEREHVGHRIMSLAVPFARLESLGQTGQSLRQRSQASNALLAALQSLDRALIEERHPTSELAVLRDLGAADAFVQRILDHVPEETLARSGSPVLTVPQLRDNFSERVRPLAVAALAPPAEGLFGKVGAALVGRLLGSLYVLPAAENDPGIPIDSPSAVAQQNLVALSRAAAFIEQGELRNALAALQGLTGECSTRAADWVREARDALLLQQAARVAQARARCLNAALH